MTKQEGNPVDFKYVLYFLVINYNIFQTIYYSVKTVR